MRYTELNTEGAFVLDDVLNANTCQTWIQTGETRGFETAPITTAHGFEHRPDIRNNTRAMWDDPPAAANLWSCIVDFMPARIGRYRVVGLNERLRIYRYDVGERFRWHYDGSFYRNEEERSLLTIMFYLNDNFDGGVTELGDEVVQARAGRVLVFPHRILHQGATVRRGRKYVLRSDIMYRRIPPSAQTSAAPSAG